MDNFQEAYLSVYEANDSYLETDMEKRKKNNEKALKDMEKTDAHKDMVATARKKFDEETDLFDYLLEYLVAEGYADTNDAAIAIMSNMSEEWRDSILDEKFISPYEGKPTYGNPQGHSPAMKALKKSDDLQKTELGSERQKKQTKRSSQLNKMFSAARRA